MQVTPFDAICIRTSYSPAVPAITSGVGRSYRASMPSLAGINATIIVLPGIGRYFQR